MKYQIAEADMEKFCQQIGRVLGGLEADEAVGDGIWNPVPAIGLGEDIQALSDEDFALLVDYAAKKLFLMLDELENKTMRDAFSVCLSLHSIEKDRMPITAGTVN